MKCPGQDSRYWDGSAIFEVKCPECGNIDEFFKDESSRKCKKCGSRMLNPKMNFGCASYCKFADQCLGEFPGKIAAETSERFKDRIASEMRSYFEGDERRINHANGVAVYAEQIAKEMNANMAVVMAAAYLHDIGIKKAEEIYNSNAAQYQEELGPAIARDILEKFKADDNLIDEVCDIIGHHHRPGEKESDNYKSVYDADQIVNMEEAEQNEMDKKRIMQMIEIRLLTTPGKKLASKNLL